MSLDCPGKRITRALVLTLVLTVVGLGQPASRLDAQMPIALEPDVQVNTYTSGAQSFSAIALDADGNMVVVWYSNGSPGDDPGASIQGQLFTANGLPAGEQAQINTYTASTQFAPDVAADDDGDFVVVWQSFGSSGSDLSWYSIQGQRYSSSGQLSGSEFQVNGYTTGWQIRPAVAMDADGDFVVVWQSAGSYGSDVGSYSIQGQRFSANGDAAGGQFQVNTYTTLGQVLPDVAMNADGDFVVVWQSYGSSTDPLDSSVQGRLFNADGTPGSPQAQVNTYTTGHQKRPAVGADREGNFVVVWDSVGSPGTDSEGLSIQGRVYASNGVPAPSQIQVNTYTTGHQRFPRVAVDADGDFLVTWQGDGSSGNDDQPPSIQGRFYGSDALPHGDDFQINSYTTSFQTLPDVAFDEDGDFVVVWTSAGSHGTDDDETCIRGRRFSVWIFKDGFETGNVSGWSSSLP